MSREIKFRAWDGEEIRYLDTMFTGVGQVGWSDVHYVDLSYTDHEEVTLMQYTGLKDARGQEIYDGDIVHSETSSLWFKVEWYEAAFCLVPVKSSHLATALKWNMNTNKMKVMSVHAMVCSKEAKDLYPLEVVGNVYQNPELLGGEVTA